MEIKSEPPKTKKTLVLAEFAFSLSSNTSTFLISRRKETSRDFFFHTFSDHFILEILVSWEMAKH